MSTQIYSVFYKDSAEEGDASSRLCDVNSQSHDLSILRNSLISPHKPSNFLRHIGTVADLSNLPFVPSIGQWVPKFKCVYKFDFRFLISCLKCYDFEKVRATVTLVSALSQEENICANPI